MPHLADYLVKKIAFRDAHESGNREVLIANNKE